jgi:NAD(P)-dependent dehydrogenase (short-subunit alcohol dehydrogenase family)
MSERVTIITGGGGNIGSGLCAAFANAGATPIAIDLDPSAADSAHQIVCDLTDPEACLKAVEEVVREFGRVDTLVNVAQQMILDVPFIDLTDEHMRISFDSGPVATLRMMQLCYPHFKAQGGGAIINFGSGAGTQGRLLCGAYAAAKEAIRGLTKTAALEWGPDNIRVNVVCPFASRNLQHEGIRATLARVPMGRVGDPEKDIGPLVLYLASPDCYMTGRTLHVDGGVAMFR